MWRDRPLPRLLQLAKRRYAAPKGIDLSLITRTQLEQIYLALKSHPRRVLGWSLPSKALVEIVAMTG